MLEQAKAVTRSNGFTVLEYARFADDLVVLVGAHPNQCWLRGAVEKRLREEFAKLEVEVNEEKSRQVDLKRCESFGFLGFEFWRVRSRFGSWLPLYPPQTRKRTALLRQLKVVFQRLRSEPINRVIGTINPILRGWVNYFAMGHSSRCFSFIRNRVEQKIRRHLARARLRRGFGWKRWSRRWLYDELGLFHAYQVRHRPKAAPVRREIRPLRVMWRELETALRRFLLGHEGGNSGYGQGIAYRVTAPALDPTRSSGPSG